MTAIRSAKPSAKLNITLVVGVCVDLTLHSARITTLQRHEAAQRRSHGGHPGGAAHVVFGHIS